VQRQKPLSAVMDTLDIALRLGTATLVGVVLVARFNQFESI